MAFRYENDVIEMTEGPTIFELLSGALEEIANLLDAEDYDVDGLREFIKEIDEKL